MAEHDVIVIGAGPAGICSGVKLKESGRDNFVILEKGHGVGGTWYHNRYPGAACDVPSHLYSFSFDRRDDWPRPYSPQPEILAYLEQCTEKYGLLPHIRFDMKVSGAEWIDDRSLWRVTTEAGDVYEARVLISALGMFNELNYPDIPGLDQFDGTAFHSANWPDNHDFAGERVAVIGSAASAVQFVPEVAQQASQLNLYQRTANWVLPKEDAPYAAQELADFRRRPEATLELRQEIFETVEPLLTYDNDELLETCEDVGRKAILEVTDPDTRKKLQPEHPYGCKRPLLSNNYYSTFNRSNVELITEGIEKVEAKGVISRDGRLREADTLILATGFDTLRFLSAIDVTGREGTSLRDVWKDGAYAYLGLMVPRFPNLFMMYGPNTNNGSIVEMIEKQVGFAMQQIDRIEREKLVRLEIKPAATDAYNEALQSDINGVGVWQADCANYYRSPSGRIVTQWPHNMGTYAKRVASVGPEAFDATPR